MNAKPRGRTLALAVAVLAAVAAVGLWMHWRTPSRYFAASEVDHVATPLGDIGLAFPPARGGIDYYGTLRLALYIDEDGRVDRVEVLESTVPVSFRDEAVQRFAATRFEPATRKGRGVKSVKKVEVRFDSPLRGLNPG